MVRPWKLPWQTTITAWLAGTPLTRYPQARATLMADSTASAPEFIGSTRSCPTRSPNSSQKGPRCEECTARLVRVTLPICSLATSMSRGCRWPKFSAE